VVEGNVIQRLSTHRLPAEYCYFDLVEGVDKPVVEHSQASREAKHVGNIIWERRKQEELEKYAKTWAVEQYRKISPGLNVAPEAFTVLRDIGLKRRDTLTDYGCGTGRAGKFFMKEGLWVCGIDICPGALEEQLDKFIPGALWDLPPETPTTDWAFCVDVLEHLPEETLATTIKGIVGHTRKGGFFQVAHFPSEFQGQQLHLTIKPNAWWVEFLKDRLPGFQNYRTDDRRSVYIFKAVGNP
jgi:SAM-dependent methyltransferase